MSIRRVALPGVLAALALLLAVPAVRHWRERPPAPAAPLRATWTPPAGLVVGAGADAPFGLAVAPDGRRLVFAASRLGAPELWLHDLSTGQAHALPATEGAAFPFWAPDATRVGFFAGGRLRSIDLASGEVADLADAPAPRGGAWSATGDIIFAPGADGPLVRRVPSGAVTPVTTVDQAAGETSHRWPALLPDGRHVVFLVRAAERARAGVWLAPVDASSARRRIDASAAQAIVAGHTVLYASDEALLAQALDPATLEPAGRAELVGLPVGRGPLDQLFATASADVLIYGAPGTTLRDLRWVNRDGAVLSRLGDPADTWDLRVAPDGRRVAVTRLDAQLRTVDVWVHDGSGIVPQRLSLSAGLDEGAAWSPDGLRVAYVTSRRTLTVRGAGAVLPEETAAKFDSPIQLWDWSARGLVIGRTGPESGSDLWLQPPTAAGPAQPYAAAPFNQTHGAVSPDGRWMAYASDESGKPDIYLDAFPKPGARVRLTTAGGTEPRWRRDGRELYFRRGSEIHAVQLDVASGFSRTTPLSTARLFDAGAGLRAYDAAPDGSRFLLNLPAASAAPTTATLVVNWSRTSHGATETRR